VGLNEAGHEPGAGPPRPGRSPRLRPEDRRRPPRRGAARPPRHRGLPGGARPVSNEIVLSLEDVRVHYGKVEALKGVSLEVGKGEIVALIGGNGAGKTTTLKTISGLRPLTSGTIRFEGRDIGGVPAHDRVRLGISQSPEGRHIFPGTTVIQNLQMAPY